ncbi:MAG: efflux RND transporter permease subunit [Alphaproteobacteria bacterium]|jgi:multidrug efflux pump subunit AcrB|nr:efflux RND transporter permease subunit [Alphaproteobacteria bacterium]
MRVGISGRLTQIFIRSPLTPLLLLASLAVGLLALNGLPREEEPQISVPMVDLMVNANGYKAPDAVELITRPLEDIIKGIDGVEHVYSQTEDDNVITTARFFAGTDSDAAILRVHEKIRANIRDLPQHIPEPLIIGRGINDVAVLNLTLSAKPDHASRWNDNQLYHLALELQHELAKTENVGLNYVVGGSANQIRVEPDPEKMALYGITLNQLVDKLTQANRSFAIGSLTQENINRPVVVGQTLQGTPDIDLLLLTSREGRPVYLKDIATVVVGGAQNDAKVWNYTKTEEQGLTRSSAITLAFAKRSGANAVTVVHALEERLEILKTTLIPQDIDVSITRNYGETATEKANELLFHLFLATVSIVLLITWAIGWREGVVVFVVIPTTILLTLFASWMMGYTINRVSLFALIFSIGILVDDAIVIVENIVRRWRLAPNEDIVDTAVDAVSEVGNPTIVATLTIIAALLPMMFVSGMMGPYMSPIPANASMAMLFSFFVAEIITPWLLLKVSGNNIATMTQAEEDHNKGALPRLFEKLATPILASRKKSKRFILYVGVATLIACLAFPLKIVPVKLLPFDNKSEMQVVIDLPKGSTAETTDRLLQDIAIIAKEIPEVTTMQAYVASAAPFNFNGLVRHSFLRSQPHQGELQINLLPKSERSRASHDIALDLREKLSALSKPDHTVLKVVEVPPGPPVMATLLAEIYGPDAQTRRAMAEKVRQAFAANDFITDIDDNLNKRSERLRFIINQENLEFYGVDEQAVYDTIAALTGGVKIGYAQKGEGARPVDITIKLPKDALSLNEKILSMPVPAGGTKREGKNVELGDVVTVVREMSSYPIYRHNGRYVEQVSAELAGRYEAPIYGMLAVEESLKEIIPDGKDRPDMLYHGQPLDESHTSLLWDGEWEVTFVTFRDMGAAFIIALLGIYLLVVGLFKSFLTPLVILVPVPLTLIGIVIGHVLFGAPFTAPSMIGFIALAGIIVRNSILVVDFIRALRKQGMPLHEALIEAGKIRIRPIVLTAAAAMVGAAFILTDPIFQGLAISLVFGIASATALTLLVIPALYIWLRGQDHADEKRLETDI